MTKNKKWGFFFHHLLSPFRGREKIKRCGERPVPCNQRDQEAHREEESIDGTQGQTER